MSSEQIFRRRSHALRARLERNRRLQRANGGREILRAVALLGRVRHAQQSRPGSSSPARRSAERYYPHQRGWGLTTIPSRFLFTNKAVCGALLSPPAGLGADNNPVQVPFHQQGGLWSAVIPTSGVGADNNPVQVPLHQQGSLWSAVIPTSRVGG